MARCGFVQRSAAVLVLAASLLLGCGDGGLGPEDVTTVQVVSGDAQFGVAGRALAQPLVVSAEDAEGNPISGIEVEFTVTQGGGQVSTATPETDDDGRASVTFTLGPTGGSIQQVTATANNHTATFNATATNAPAAIHVFAGNGQSAASGTAVPSAAQVQVVDAGGLPVPGVAVTFQVTRGGGAVTGGAKITGVNGVAAPDQWTLGPSGVNTLDATADVETLVGEPATITATTSPAAGQFDIIVRYQGSPSPAQVLAFAEAEVRWEALITSDLEDAPTGAIPAGTCGDGTPAINETIDDLIIFALFESIDGPGNLLAQAGPCLLRDFNGNGEFEVGDLPGVGVMFFDTDDLDEIEQNGTLSAVALHEMGHVLGFGALWRPEGLLADPSLPPDNGTDPHFTGAQAIAAFNAAGGSSYSGAKVPVENIGGPATADSHWRESVFDNELMTGFVSLGPQPLSAITLQSFVDQAYTVNAAGADSYTLPPSGIRLPGSLVGLRLGNDLAPVPIRMLGRNGGLGRIIRR
jgi:Bacterial Ig-like domain (group 1)/Leishmanolysin